MYPSPLPPAPNYDPPIHTYVNGTSVNGLTEYTVPTFGGQMLGNLITASWAGDQSVRRVVLNADGSDVVFDETLATLVQPLDVDVGPDGSIYVAEHGGDSVQLLKPAAPLTGDWATEAPLPVAAQEVGVVGCGGKVYVLGGITAPDTNTHDVWVYDPLAGTWSAAADYSGTAVDHPGAACVNGKVYLIGGLINANAPVSQVLEYTPSTNSWTSKANLPRARGAMGVAVVGSAIYAAGGVQSASGPAVSDMAVFDPAANSWTQLAPMPTPRDHLVMEAIGGRLYAMGGRDAQIDAVLAANEAYDPATGTWEARAALPVPRAGMASAALHGQIQIWGGEGPSGTPTGTYPQGQMYDPWTNTWLDIAGEPTPRHGTDAAQIGDRAYIPGGGPQIGGSVTDVNEVFSFIGTEPPASCIPEGSDPTTTDSDGDGYTNQDEIDNGTDPCSSASRPPDADSDNISDRNDPDDDNDGVPDVDDQFQLDPANGQSTTLPWTQDWNPGSNPAGGFGNSGFPGVQLTSNGTGFIPHHVHVGGAGGFLTVNPTAGTYHGASDNQDNALQVGFDATDPTSISTRIADPLSGQPVVPGKYGGIFVGLDEDNYVELILTTDTGAGSTGLLFAAEFNGSYGPVPSAPPVSLPLPGPGFVELFLDVDPAAGTIEAAYRVDSSDPADRIVIGAISAATHAQLANLFVNGLGAGVAGTNTTASAFAIAYDYYRIEAAGTVTPITITTASLPGGTLNQAYSAQLQASGGTTPYSWQVTAGSVPPGLTLNAATGSISGTPTAQGNYSFTITVTGSGSPAQTTSKQFTLKIRRR
jgi:N-acetylneuraminic acid mutarotase